MICIDDLGLTTTKTKESLSLKKSAPGGMYNHITTLWELWYNFSEHATKWSYKRYWDILSIRDHSGINTYTISYWGEEIESIEVAQYFEDICIWKHLRESIHIGSPDSLLSQDWLTQESPLYEILAQHHISIIFDTVEFHNDYRKYMSLFSESICFEILGNWWQKSISLELEPLEITTLELLKQTLETASTHRIIYTKNIKLVRDFLEYNSISGVILEEVSTHILKSFEQKSSLTQDQKPLRVICDDIISTVFTRKRVKRKLSQDIDLLLKIKKGDYVIHIDHGIGVFHEIVTKDFWNVSKEYVELHYKENDKLFVPITEVSRISKYVGKEHPNLTPLSWKIWEKKIAKIREDIQHIAEELLTNFAKRKLRTWVSYVQDTKKIETFQAAFPYTYTSCQQNAIEEIFADMKKNTVMDRLLVWDVGFWKTEIAFNAMYNALTNGRQVAFIAPLIVLAYEHFEKALERFETAGFSIEIVTRMESQKNITRIKKWLQNGSIHLVIWTHRLLWKWISFKDLGLIVIDEEHKFWVQDKEKIKQLRQEVDVLSMSATPIPRSLNLALSGIRDISVLKTPPAWRKNIETYISPYEEKIIQDAGNKELKRGWQIFFVHNRVRNIEIYKKNIQKLFPKRKIVVTHGQLPGDELENRIMDFKMKKYDILLSTTVIENGIDFSNVNTIFINECQSFGISQLHQLRGRVGRSDKKWYCYLLYKKDTLSNESAKRLHTVVNYSYLWAGFELAMKDLEVRWWWDILGIRQSGQTQEIGVSLFLKMLEEKIEELKMEQKQGTPQKKKTFPTIDLQISAKVPDEYFQSETDKIQFYREIESLESLEDLNSMIEWFTNIHTTPSKEMYSLFDILKTKILSTSHNIISMKSVGINYQIDFHETTSLEQLKDFLRLDKNVSFHVVDVKRVRAWKKLFENDEKFLQYVLGMFEKKVWNPKIKLKKK